VFRPQALIPFTPHTQVQYTPEIDIGNSEIRIGRALMSGNDQNSRWSFVIWGLECGVLSENSLTDVPLQCYTGVSRLGFRSSTQPTARGDRT
jgi:hypothetical protein